MRSALLFVALTGVIGTADLARTAGENRVADAGAFRVPFRVGEQLSYQAKLNFISASSATLSVNGLETVRGHTTYHPVFDVHGRLLFLHVNDHFESWFSCDNFSVSPS